MDGRAALETRAERQSHTYEEDGALSTRRYPTTPSSISHTHDTVHHRERAHPKQLPPPPPPPPPHTHTFFVIPGFSIVIGFLVPPVLPRLNLGARAEERCAPAHEAA